MSVSLKHPVWSLFSLEELKSKIDEVVDIEATRYSARVCVVKLFSVRATLVAALVDEEIIFLYFVCFSQREVSLLTYFLCPIISII